MNNNLTIFYFILILFVCQVNINYTSGQAVSAGSFVAPNYGVLIGYYSNWGDANRIAIVFNSITIYDNTTGGYPGRNGNTYCPVEKGMTYTITKSGNTTLTFYPYKSI